MPNLKGANQFFCTFLLLALGLSVFGLRLNLQRLTAQDELTGRKSTPLIVNNTLLFELLTFGDRRLEADICWLAFVQYIGSVDTPEIEEVYKALNVISQLDPKFVQPYYFAAFIIGSELKHPELAHVLIRRGIEANQDNWYLPFIAGINQYLFAQNETAAANYYRLAAKFPDAPTWLSRQAEILEAKIPSLVKEVNTWDTIYRTSGDPLVKERAKDRLAVTWMRVFKVSPSEEIRKRARKALGDLGIEVR